MAQKTTLRRLREEGGLSLLEASRRTKIDQAQLSRIETGRQLPTIQRLRQLGDLYGVAPWKILQWMEQEGEV